MILKTMARLTEQGKLHPPDWLAANCAYLTIMGSVAYGVSVEASDVDIYGCAVPPKLYIFPHLYGYIPNFGTPPPKFDQYTEHHVSDSDSKKVYDFSIFSIVRYLHLLMDGNPNVIDSIFTDRDCVLYSNQIGELIRDNKTLFLHKGLWPKYKGYAYSQLHKMTSPDRTGKRKAVVEEYGYDLKFAMHTVRLLLELEQIFDSGELNLRQNNEQLKSIRRGDWPLSRIRTWFADTENRLENLKISTRLPDRPDEEKIKQLLLNCLESHYGSLSEAVQTPGAYRKHIIEIAKIVNRALVY